MMSTQYQRMEYLRMYLTPKVKSSMSYLLTDPNQYTMALQSLKRKYGHPLLIAKANLAGNLPYIRSRDVQSLEKFTGCLSDVISSLTRAGLLHCNRKRLAEIAQSSQIWMGRAIILRSPESQLSGSKRKCSARRPPHPTIPFKKPQTPPDRKTQHPDFRAESIKQPRELQVNRNAREDIPSTTAKISKEGRSPTS